MQYQFIIKNIVNGCYFKLSNNTTRECFNYVTSEHDKDEVIVMSELETMFTPMCNIYPEEDLLMVAESFAMDILPKQMKLFGEFWLHLLKQDNTTDTKFTYIKRRKDPLIECVGEIVI